MGADLRQRLQIGVNCIRLWPLYVALLAVLLRRLGGAEAGAHADSYILGHLALDKGGSLLPAQACPSLPAVLQHILCNPLLLRCLAACRPLPVAGTRTSGCCTYLVIMHACAGTCMRV